MPVIVFATSKGGAGKSTSAVLLAEQLAERAASVILIDGDPNKPVTKWAKRPGKPATLTVVSDISEETIIETIEAAAAKAAFVIVDLEGAASRMIPYAISRADLVIIPTQGSQLDAAESVKVLNVVRMEERHLRIRIPAVILFTRTSQTIRPRDLGAIMDQFRSAGVPIMTTEIHERQVYKSIFGYGQTLAGLDPSHRGLVAAKANARAFMNEVIGLLKHQTTPEAAEVA
jgi:chromosome partitioning protein